MPDINTILLLAIVLITFGLFISGHLRIDLVALCVLAALVLTGLISTDQALYGFANPATATIAAVFVVSAGLIRTGLVGWLARRVDKLAGKGEARLILVLCCVVAVLSAFLVNTAIVAIFIPITIVLAGDRRIPYSRVLIPISFASQFGGVCTIIGTSTNMLVNGIAISQDILPFSFFEFAPLGLVMLAVGIVYLVLTSRWLLPKRKGEAEQVDKYRLADYLAEFQVLGDSQLVGNTWEQSNISRETKVELSNLLREGKAVTCPIRTKIRPGDLLLLHGHMEQIIAMEHKYGLELMKNITVRDLQLNSPQTQLIEILIPPGSNLIGNTLQKSNFFRRNKASILAIQRRGKVVKERLLDIELNSHDTLLIQAGRDDIQRLMNSANVIVTNQLPELYFRKDKAIAALLVTLTMVCLAAFSIVPVMIAAIVGGLGMILTRCLTIEEAYTAIDWKIIFLLGGIIPLGLAMEQSGAMLLLVDSVLKPLLANGAIVLLASTYLVTAVLTAFMSNNATAAILAPIAVLLARSIGADPRPFLVAITFAASTSFATPIGYQTNTMVYSPGGYRFLDFTRIGLPLNIIFFILSIVMIPLIWPLK